MAACKVFVFGVNETLSQCIDVTTQETVTPNSLNIDIFDNCDAFVICWSEDRKHIGASSFYHERLLWINGNAKRACLERLKRCPYYTSFDFDHATNKAFGKWFELYQTTLKKQQKLKELKKIKDLEELEELKKMFKKCLKREDEQSLQAKTDMDKKMNAMIASVQHKEKKEILLERQVLYSVQMYPSFDGSTSSGTKKMMAVVYTQSATELRYGASIWVFSGTTLMEYDFQKQQDKLNIQAEVRFNLFPIVLNCSEWKLNCECEKCWKSLIVKCVEKFGVRADNSEWTTIEDLPSNDHIAAVNAVRQAFQR